MVTNYREGRATQRVAGPVHVKRRGGGTSFSHAKGVGGGGHNKFSGILYMLAKSFPLS